MPTIAFVPAARCGHGEETCRSVPARFTGLALKELIDRGESILLHQLTPGEPDIGIDKTCFHDIPDRDAPANRDASGFIERDCVGDNAIVACDLFDFQRGDGTSAQVGGMFFPEQGN